MSDESLKSDVLTELGDDRVEELARELGTDTEGARRVVEATVTALPDTIGDTLAGLVGRLSVPTARTVAHQTGLPFPEVSRALELLLPIALSVLAGRRPARS